MSKSFNKVNTNIDLNLLTIKTEKEPKKEMVTKINNSIVKMDTFDELDTRNITIKHAIQILNQQWRLNGLRPRTIDSYNYNFKRFVEVTKVEYLHEINNEKIYQYLSSFKNAKDTSLHGRLKQIKAVLSKCHDNGWYNSKFWTNIKIKVNTSVKEATTERELALLLSLLDKSTYSGLRDSIAILLLYKTGIRIKTLGALREQNIDFENMLLKLQGEIMKSHRPLILPLDDEMCTLLRELISINDDVRKEHREKNDYIFLSNIGVPISNTVSPSNLIAKNLWVYSKKWNLKNINPHSIRRLYAQNLVKRGADINLVSHALAHSDLSTTTRYLGLDIDTVAKNLRDFL